MAELNLKQITDKLNHEFKGDDRRIVFWYDDNAEFIDDIGSLEIENAKIFKLEKDNQFYTKYILERKDMGSNYLIYSPFPKPDVRDNHLEDTVLYSKRFYADRVSLLMVDLGIDQELKPVIQRYIKFFGAKDRTQKFYDLGIDTYSEDAIIIGLMSVLCKVKISNFEEVLKAVIIEGELEENKFLEEFEKYDLKNQFWKMCEIQLGYSDLNPTIEKLLITMFVTYTQKQLKVDVPDSWKRFLSFKSGSIMAFLGNLMHHRIYKDRIDTLSKHISALLQASKALEGCSPESVMDCDTFQEFDWIIIDWIKERLIEENLGVKLNRMSIPQICGSRRKGHFADKYHLLESAYHVINAVNYEEKSTLVEIIKKYKDEDHNIDYRYRRFYYNYDMLQDAYRFEKLRDRVENIYTNEYLEKITYRWNKALKNGEKPVDITPQREFYRQYIQNSKDRVVVIISDAMRYEVGKELYDKLFVDEKCTPELDIMIGNIPSYTRLGMAALLPNTNITMTEDYKVLVDGMPCDSIGQREAILKKTTPNSRCVQFDDIKHMMRNELREVFTGMEVVYVYHNQIDARGDKANTENEVFIASYEAIDELYSFIKRVSVSANTYHFIITSDHGYIYKRDKLQEKDKISNMADKEDYVNRRFIISKESLEDNGVVSYKLGKLLGNDDERYVNVPLSSNVFKVQGGGQNFVHGGSSPHEMIIPVIDVKVEKYHAETKPARIALVSMFNKITNLIVSLDFIQTEPISDVVKETTYKLYFVSEDNEKITNENIYVADRKDTDDNKRIFRLRFNFKNKVYDKTKRYYLAVVDAKNDVELFRHEVLMDLAFSNDFGFDA